MTKRNAIQPNDLAKLLKATTPGHHTDGAGLFLATTGVPKRAGSWRFEFKSPTTGKRSKITLGACWLDNDGKTVHGMTVGGARTAHQEARNVIAAGNDPVQAREEVKQTVQDTHAQKKAVEDENRERARRNLPPVDSFRDVFARYEEDNRHRLKPVTLYNMRKAFERHAFPIFGDKHVNEVTRADLLALDERLVKLGIRRMLYKLRQDARTVFEWAMHPKRELRTAENPVYDDPKLWDGMYSKPRAAVKGSDNIATVMHAINSWVPKDRWGNQTHSVIKDACIFAAYVGQRPHMIAGAEKAEFDLDAGTWTIPAPKMKGRRTLAENPDAKPHVVYLARQMVALLRDLFARFPSSRYVFPGYGKAKGGHMHKGAINKQLVLLGFKDKQSAHGFRALMRTTCEEELGCNPVILEMMLSHKHAKVASEHAEIINKILTGGMNKVYARGTWDKEQAAYYQKWANHLDKLNRPKLALVA